MLLALLLGASGTLFFLIAISGLAAILSLMGLQGLPLNRRPAGRGHRLLLGLGLFGSSINWVYVSIAQIWRNAGRLTSSGCAVSPPIFRSGTGLFAGILSRLWPKTTLAARDDSGTVVWQITEFLRLGTDRLPWLQFGYSL